MTKNNTSAFQIEWEDPDVQAVAFRQALLFQTQMVNRGYELSDLIQEMAVVFVKALDHFWKQPEHGHRDEPFDTSGQPTKLAFLAFFKRCCHLRLIDLNRFVQRRRTVDTTIQTEEDGHDMVTAVDARHARSELELALDEAPAPVATFVREFERNGLQTRDETGTFQKRADFSMRVAGVRWTQLRPMIEKWAFCRLEPA